MDTCECCEAPIDGRCSGLDVPELSFCATHLREHEKDCPEIKAGRSHIWWIERTSEGGDRG